MSKKLVCAIAAMAADVLIVFLTGVKVIDPQIAALAIVSVTGLGGFQIREQAKLDANGGGSGQ